MTHLYTPSNAPIIILLFAVKIQSFDQMEYIDPLSLSWNSLVYLIDFQIVKLWN